MPTDLFTAAPDLFARLRGLWLSACGRRRRRRDLESTREALAHRDDPMRRDIGLGPRGRPLLARADIILRLPG